jgi:hypothetical protein
VRKQKQKSSRKKNDLSKKNNQNTEKKQTTIKKINAYLPIKSIKSNQNFTIKCITMYFNNKRNKSKQKKHPSIHSITYIHITLSHKSRQ